MVELEGVAAELRYEFEEIIKSEEVRKALLNSPTSPARKDDRDKALREYIDAAKRRVTDILQHLINFPPQHVRRGALLDRFNSVADFRRSVFVMTKFPDQKSNKPEDAQLAAVIEAVRDAVTTCGYVARVACDDRYDSSLWDNVEVYLLGCHRGIAIVEDKYLPELNPNVAMEWGWMRGMGREVLYLVENDFNKQRADWSGLIEDRFEWANPRPGIEDAIRKWLK